MAAFVPARPEDRTEAKQTVWPWFVAGALSPFGARLLSGVVTPWMAAALSFFVLFSAAALVTRRKAGTLAHPLGRGLLAGAVGGVVVGALTYAFR
jgi:hypothetical protein